MFDKELIDNIQKFLFELRTYFVAFDHILKSDKEKSPLEN